MLDDREIVTCALDADEAENGEYWVENAPEPGLQPAFAAASEALRERLESDPGAFGAWIAPTTVREFCNRYWQRSPLFVPAPDHRDRFSDLYSFRMLEQAVRDRIYRPESFRFVKDFAYQSGEPPTPRDGDSGDASLEAFMDGAARSVVIDDVHRYHRGLNDIWNDLLCAFAFPPTCTAYYTPASGQTFPTHWDTDDVVILHLEGRKRWRIFEPIVRDPLEHHRWSKYDFVLGAPRHEQVLEPGDVLYLPRGWPHEVVAMDQAPALHITLGISVPSWHITLKLLFERVLLECGQSLAFRQPNPMLWRGRGAADDDLRGSMPTRALYERLSGILCERLSADRMRDVLEDFIAEHALWGTMANEGSGPADPDGTAVRLQPSSRLERRRRPFFLDADDTHVTLKLPGKRVRFPRRVDDALRFMAATASFRLRDIPSSLDGRDRRTLVRRLIAEGFLRHAARP